MEVDGVNLRPFVHVKGHSIASDWLYDTGADCSVMSTALFETIPLQARPPKRNSYGVLRSASKNTLKVHGVFDMSLQVMGKNVKAPIYVCENLNQPAILGMDIIQQLGLSFNPVSRRFDFNISALTGTEPSLALCLPSAVTIPPLCSAPVRLSVRSSTPSTVPTDVTGVAVIHTPEYPLLSGGPGLVSINNVHEVTVLINNCSPCAAELPRGTSLGFLDLPGGPPQIITAEKLVSHLDAISKPRPVPLTPERRAEFLKDLNLKVPANELAAYQKLLLDNFDVFSRHKLDLGTANNFEHTIKLKTNEPVYVKQFRIPESHRDALLTQVNEWLKLGIIQPTHSRFNSPIFVVPKKDGTMRFVLDYRALNANSLDDRYNMKDVSECIGDIGRAGSTIFSTLDLTAGFWQMPLDPKSRPYTAFTIPGLGQFQWTRGAMGLKGCPSSFQRLVELAVKDIQNIIVYIDDLLTHSRSHEEHRHQLAQLFDRLRRTGLKLNLPKCEFGSTNVSYLGFRLTPEGILPGFDKLQVVREAKPPTTVKEIRQFLGLCNFFRTHVRNFAQVSSALSKLTCKDSGWVRGTLPPDALQAFHTLRLALISEPVVAYPRKDRPYSLIVDASTGGEDGPGGMGAILCQQDKQGNHHAIAYASRGLVKHEKNYTPFLAELMACVWGMKHFDVYLRGRHFTLYTDHRPLEKLGKVHTKTLNRLMEAMTEYDFEIKYKKGAEMPADFLSRNVLAEISIFDKDLLDKQKADPFCVALREFLLSGTLTPDTVMARTIKTVAPSCFLENDILWRRILRNNMPARAVVILPASLVPSIVNEAHGGLLTGHGGITKTKERILQSYYWPGMDSHIAQHLKSCQKCLYARKDDKPPSHILHPLPQCSAPNQRIHADLFGPLRTSESGKKYVLCITDAFHKYAEILALPNKEAATVSNAIFNRWICRYGLPQEIVTDNGKEFAAKVADDLYALLKIQHTTTTPYHPQCNAQAEVLNKFVAKYLARIVEQNTLDWELYLPPLMFAYNTSVHRTTKATPHFLNFGVEARIPHFPHHSAPNYGESLPAEWLQRLQLCRQLATQESLSASATSEADHNAKASHHLYTLGQLVLLNVQNFLGVNRKLAANWEGPYPIVKVFDNGVVDIQTARRVLRVNVHRLKPYVSPLGLQQVPVPVPVDTTLPPTNPPPAPRRNDIPGPPQPPPPQFLQPDDFPPLPNPPRPPQPPPLPHVPAPQPPPPQAQPPPPPAGRPRGRPKGTAKNPTPPPIPTPQNPTILTRSAARALAASGQPPNLLPGLLNSITSHVINTLLKNKVPLSSVGLPVTPSNYHTRRRRYLQVLPPGKRNLLLTGDPGFAYDPLIYEYVFRTPPNEWPIQFHHVFGHIATPPETPPSSPEPSPPHTPAQSPPHTPPHSPHQTPPQSPPQTPPQTPPQSPLHSPPPSPPRSPTPPFHTPQVTPPVTPPQRHHYDDNSSDETPIPSDTDEDLDQTFRFPNPFLPDGSTSPLPPTAPSSPKKQVTYKSDSPPPQVNPFGTGRCLARTPPPGAAAYRASSSPFPWPSGAHASGFSLPSSASDLTAAARHNLERLASDRPSTSRPKPKPDPIPPRPPSTRTRIAPARYMDFTKKKK